METITIILVLVDVVREPIESLTTNLPVTSSNNTYDLIFLAPNLLFLQERQLTFDTCPKQTDGNHYHHLSLGRCGERAN
jgi:hypothetical protein